MAKGKQHYPDTETRAVVPAEPLPLPLDQNPSAVFLASLISTSSQRVTHQALRVIAALLVNGNPRTIDILSVNWGGLRYAHTAAIRARLAQRYSVATANRMLSALRGVLKEAWRLGYMSAEDYQRAVDIQNIKGSTVPSGRELTRDEIQALVDVCRGDESPAGRRDVALIGLLYTCGLRRSEVVALNRADVDLNTGRIVVRAGKGRKQRTVFAPENVLCAVERWLRLVPPEALSVFVPVLKNERIVNRRLSDQSIYDILKKRALQASVADFSPHDFRRTFVGDMLDLGVDIATVANIAGHASVDTTRRYDRRPEDTKKKAAEKMQFPG